MNKYNCESWISIQEKPLKIFKDLQAKFIRKLLILAFLEEVSNGIHGLAYELQTHFPGIRIAKHNGHICP